MTPKEREKLIEDMAKIIWDKVVIETGYKEDEEGLVCATGDNWRQYIPETRAALAIAERRIQEDCAEIAAQKPLHLIKETDGQTSYVRGRNDAGLAILASMPEKKDD